MGHCSPETALQSSTICGSDIRCIYHEYLGKGPEGYQGVIARHEPCGHIVKTGPGCRRFGEGDRVIVYHISGCGVCNDCRRGYMISCISETYRRPTDGNAMVVWPNISSQRKKISCICQTRLATWPADSELFTKASKKSGLAAMMPY